MISGVVMYSHFCILSILSVFSGNLKLMSTNKKGSSSLLGLLGKLFGLSAIAGLLTLVMVAPVAAVGGFATSAGFSIFDGLPDYIKPVNASQSSTLYGTLDDKPVAVATFYHENRISIDYDAMSPNIRNAVVATEDPRFFQHGGIDILSLIRAAATSATSGLSGSGASTITMQYVKNSLVESANLTGDEEAIAAATAVSIDRKLREMRLAIALEQIATKKEILAGYLNLSFFGNQLNGIEAASNYYFGISASELDVPQAALLAGMLKSPNDYKPDEEGNLVRAKERRDYVINNMRDEGYITSAEAETYKNEPITPNITKAPSGCEASQETAYFCDYVVWTIRNSPEFGLTLEDRENLLRRGGLEIYSSMDIDLQTRTDKVVKRELPVDNQWGLGAASVSVEVGTGRVLAMSQNRVFSQIDDEDATTTSVNYSTDRDFGGSSGFQTGSTYKVFVLAEWLSKGFLLGDRVDARKRVWDAEDFSARCGGLVGTWEPQNSNNAKFVNETVLRSTTQSINTSFASMASQLDLCDIRDTAMRFGVKRADGNELAYVPSSVLGTNELSPLSLAGAMATFSNSGRYCTPVAIDRVVVRSTKTEMRVPETQCSVAVSPEVAAAATYAFQQVISGGTGTRSVIGDGVPIAGKTGTSDKTIQTWMTGFSSKVATASWVGNVQGAQPLDPITVRGAYGGGIRHEIWRNIMQRANKLYGGDAFPAPPASYLGASSVVVPSVTGMLPEDAQEFIISSGLSAKIAKSQVTSSLPAGTVAYTDSASGEEVTRGSLITIYVSRGGTAIVPDVSGLTIAEATNVLLASGFPAVGAPQPSQPQYFEFSNSIPKGYVIGTSPPAGSVADGLGAILLIISKGPATG
jgi:membrane peptidoglycan carboxypeptidase